MNVVSLSIPLCIWPPRLDSHFFFVPSYPQQLKALFVELSQLLETGLVTNSKLIQEDQLDMHANLVSKYDEFKEALKPYAPVEATAVHTPTNTAEDEPAVGPIVFMKDYVPERHF